MKYTYFSTIAILFLIACSGPKNTTTNTTETPTIEVEFLDTVEFVSPEVVEDEPNYVLDTYNPSFTRRTDLIHTSLTLKFDWQKQHVLGKAKLVCSPLFYDNDKLRLDAKNFDIHNISLGNSGQKLNYEYDGKILIISLDRAYSNAEEYTVQIDYTAKPNEGEEGGSAAITSDKGLFFINPLGEQKDKPQQIWTQGETENNSRWFPTIDKPNERCTQEMYITVQNRFETLSNGIKVSSTDNDDGTRTDYWKMNQAHAPYLFMLAIGEFAVVNEDWKGKELLYYVEPEYRADAKKIFNHTPEMLSFFSEYVGVDYPFDKYAQVVVRDYVSGAMENTTGVIFGEFVQKHSDELEFAHNDLIVAHEMIHHWFGDYVTCESWANLTLNEGFANYGEYLWFEEKYGSDYAEMHRLNEKGGYMQQARMNAHPLIHFEYFDKEDMFDAHSYNKGGLVLHMLRKQLGDDAFRAGLKKYLEDNAFQAVEIHNLRLAFESVSGEDLNWFFNQWFLESGHPELKVEKDYDASKNKLLLTVEQTQNPEEFPAIFQLPIEVDFYYQNGTRQRKSIMVNERRQFLEFDVEPNLVFVNFDPEKTVLCNLDYPLNDRELIFQYENGVSFRDKFDAISGLRNSQLSESNDVYLDALISDSEYLMNAVLNGQKIYTIPGAKDIVAKIAAGNTKHINIQRRALSLLGNFNDPIHLGILENIINDNKSVPLKAAALSSVQKLDAEKAQNFAEKLINEPSPSIRSSIATIFGQSGNLKYVDFFREHLNKLNGYESISFLQSYKSLISLMTPDEQVKELDLLFAPAIDMGSSPWLRMSCTRTIVDLRNGLQAKAAKESLDLSKEIDIFSKALDQIMEKEENEQLRSIYASIISKA